MPSYASSFLGRWMDEDRSRRRQTPIGLRAPRRPDDLTKGSRLSTDRVTTSGTPKRPTGPFDCVAILSSLTPQWMPRRNESQDGDAQRRIATRSCLSTTPITCASRTPTSSRARSSSAERLRGPAHLSIIRGSTCRSASLRLLDEARHHMSEPPGYAGSLLGHSTFGDRATSPTVERSDRAHRAVLPLLTLRGR
jgi:hypothetical protein